MPAETILTIAAVITALGIIFTAVYATYRIVNRIGAVLGVDKDGRSISDRLNRVEHQLWENGGTSLADRVNNIEMHVLKVSTEMDVFKELILAQQAANTQEQKISRQRAKKAS
jgi:hypothetical protein